MIFPLIYLTFELKSNTSKALKKKRLSLDGEDSVSCKNRNFNRGGEFFSCNKNSMILIVMFFYRERFF